MRRENLPHVSDSPTELVERWKSIAAERDALERKVQRLGEINEIALAACIRLVAALSRVRQDYQHHDCMSDGCVACFIDAELAAGEVRR